MSASIIWDSFAGTINVIRGAFADTIGLPGRIVAPIAALISNTFGSINPAFSAIVSGDVFPNFVLFSSIGCVALVMIELRKKQPSTRSTLEYAVLHVLSLSSQVSRALFFADAFIQSVSLAASLAGQSHNLHSSLRFYDSQNTLLSAYLIPFVVPLRRVVSSSPASPPTYITRIVTCVLFQMAALFVAAIKCCSLLRIAKLLGGSGAFHLATVVNALAAADATRKGVWIISNIFDSSFGLAMNSYPRDGYENRRESREKKATKIWSAAQATFFGCLSLQNNRLLVLDGFALFFLFETLSPLSLVEFCKRNIFKPSFDFICSAVTWLYVSAWPVIQSSFRAFIGFLCRLSAPFTIVYNSVITPLWCVLSPLVIPSILAYIAFHRASIVAHATSRLLLVTDGIFAATAAFSSAVLYAHASSRVFHWDVDPFQHEALRWLGSRVCDCVLLPMDLLLNLLRIMCEHVLVPVMVHVLVPLFENVMLPILRQIFHLVVAVGGAIAHGIKFFPVFSVACVVVANVLVVYFCYSSATFAPIFSSILRIVASCSSAAIRLTWAPFVYLVNAFTANNSVDGKDTILALGILALIQMHGCVFIRRALRSCKPLPLLPASQQQMSQQELQGLAESMSLPRQVHFFFQAISRLHVP